jgi:hypothetical protein
MKECDNSTRKIHKSSNFILSISLLIMFNTLLLRPSLHCYTPLHFTTLHPTTLRYTSPHFTQLHFTKLIDTSLPLIYTSLPSHLALPIYISYRSISPHITKLDTVLFSHLQTYFRNNKPLHCSKELLTISLHFASLFILFYFFTYSINSTLHFTLLFMTTTHFLSLLLFISLQEKYLRIRELYKKKFLLVRKLK